MLIPGQSSFSQKEVKEENGLILVISLADKKQNLPPPSEEEFILKIEGKLSRAEQATEAIIRSNVPTRAEDFKEKEWHERIGIRGYVQFRYNETLQGDNSQVSLWMDRSVGESTSFFIRRARIIFFGDISEHLYLYIQPDFASTPSGSNTTHFGQLRDAYADIFFDKKKEFRIRAGQSKIPFSFENMQSSQLRLALDRNDALNSCCRDERDIGAFFYWTPTHVRERFRYLIRENLKGSGDYGVFALGAYNGQGANRFEQNDQTHFISRVSYPYQFENKQIFEAGVQAYTGRFVPSTGPNIDGVTPTLDTKSSGFRDRRVGVHAVLYPQPLGFQAEWNWGEGPQLNSAQSIIETASLQGGYLQTMYKLDTEEYGTWFPFIKWQYYDGALKFERNAPNTTVQDLELGLEWQPIPEVELVAVYTLMNRTNVRDVSYQRFDADIFRLQLQWNFF
jgi:hypothetical protein